MLDPLQLNFQFIHLHVRVLLSNTQILRIAQVQNMYACNIAGVSPDPSTQPNSYCTAI